MDINNNSALNKFLLRTSIVIFSFLFGQESKIGNVLNSIHLNNNENQIIIDGEVNVLEWHDAKLVNINYEINPGENMPTSHKTDVLITYDHNNIYFAFIAYDNPQSIRVNESKRDNIFNDDMVGIILDIQNDAVMGYQFFCNPNGNQADIQTTQNIENIEWNAVWESAGSLHEQGYSVEISIPFSTFKINNSNSIDWRINFLRYLPRNDTRREYSWVENNRDNECYLCQLGILKGIQNIDQNHNLNILPSYITSFENSSINDFSLGFSIPIKNINAELTINPDFSQVESDLTEIDINSNTALFYPESRPFFNEGTDLFNTGENSWRPKVLAIYTRSINKPIWASKIIGQSGEIWLFRSS